MDYNRGIIHPNFEFNQTNRQFHVLLYYSMYNFPKRGFIALLDSKVEEEKQNSIQQAIGACLEPK